MRTPETLRDVVAEVVGVVRLRQPRPPQHRVVPGLLDRLVLPDVRRAIPARPPDRHPVVLRVQDIGQRERVRLVVVRRPL